MSANPSRARARPNAKVHAQAENELGALLHQPPSGAKRKFEPRSRGVRPSELDRGLAFGPVFCFVDKERCRVTAGLDHSGSDG
jgi:hypothetical protein